MMTPCSVIKSILFKEDLGVVGGVVQEKDGGRKREKKRTEAQEEEN